MKYFLDTEFNGFGGELISLALVREDLESLYIVYNRPKNIEPWVAENVIPILWMGIDPVYQGKPVFRYDNIGKAVGASIIAAFLTEDDNPIIITDWPDDVKYLCEAIITSPGTMASINKLSFTIVRCDAYPTEVANAVQHNAWWDAVALRQLLLPTPTK